jgi:hypothetical protein
VEESPRNYENPKRAEESPRNPEAQSADDTNYTRKSIRIKIRLLYKQTYDVL